MRISIVGTSGSGKSTLGKAIATRLGLPFIELDAIRHQANWVELPDPQFLARVKEITDTEAWVIDGNYSAVRSLVRSRATQIVWLDLPRWQVMIQVLWRSISRVVLRTELWNGNRERLRSLFHPEHPIWWAYNTYDRRKREYEGALDPRWVRLRSHEEARHWLGSVVMEPVGGNDL
jgi:adenylate kinase family enzyme